MVYYEFKRLVLVFFCLIICYISVGQTIIKNNPYNEVSIASPTAASLGKYGDIPVNNHTGIPQINVPIYTIKNGPLSLPISLSYHASGLKSQEPSSWVGAGWALNAGGLITRSVMGGPDEKGTSAGAVENYGYFSEYGVNNYLYNSTAQDYQEIANGHKDGEPDLFFFNFGGYSGKFYFNDDHTPMLVPESDLKIVPYFPLLPGSQINQNIQGFTITTPDGLQYCFGITAGFSGTAPIEITNAITTETGPAQGTVISSWYLSKIVSPDNQFSINLDYIQENYGFFSLSMLPIDPIQQRSASYQPSNTYTYDLVKNIVQGVRLKSISYKNGAVTFNGASTARTDLSDASSDISLDNTNTSAKALGSIQISDQGGFCKNFNFSYSYFNDPTTSLQGFLAIPQMNFHLQTDRLRLRLDQMQEQSCSGINIPAHIFSYFGEFVPRRINFGIDHWGFINGQTGNTDLVPSYSVVDNSRATQYPGANREANWPAMRAGSLQKILYPTGGSTTLDFEANDTYVNTTTSGFNSIAYMAVGYDGNTTPSSTSFSYYNAYSSLPAQITLNNNAGSFTAHLDIKNSSGTIVYSAEASAGQTNQVTFQLSDAMYTGILSILNYGQPNPSGHGCNAQISQWQTISTPGNSIVGGLRIKTITNIDNVTSQNIATSYNYLSGNQSTGILYSIPVYVGIIRNDIFQKQGYYNYDSGFTPFIGDPYGCPTFPDAPYFVSSATLRPMANTQGYHLGYSQVKVSQAGNGSTIYQYYGSSPYQSTPIDVCVKTVNNSGCDNTQPSYPYSPLPFDLIRGELKNVSIYNEGGQILKESSYFPVYQSNQVTTPGAIMRSAAGYLLGTFYNLSTGHLSQMETDETVYSPGLGSVKTVKTDFYQSNFHHQVTSSHTSTSAGLPVITNFKYANDFRLANCDAIADGWRDLQTNCNTCLANYNSTYTQCNGNSNVPLCQSQAYLVYQRCLSTARNSYVSYRQSNFTNSSNNFQSNHDAAKNSSSTDISLKSILQLQDDYRNPAIEISSFKNNNLLAAAYNVYDYSLNPSQCVYLSKIQNLNISSPSTNFTSSSNSSTTVSKDNRYADETFTKYIGGNLVQVIKKDGVSTTYLWGYNSDFPIAKVVGATYDQLPTLNQVILQNPSSDQALRDELNKIRTALPTALVSTYTYSKLLGITSETDPTGKIMYYEYDALGHLKLIRDLDNNILKTFNYQYQQTP